MCSDAPPPPDFTPIAEAMKEIGGKMEALGSRQLAFSEQRYNETMPFYQRMVQSNMEGQDLAMQMARESSQDRQKYRALEDSFVNEAMGEDRASFRNLQAGRAASDVEQANQTAKASAVRNLSRMGINPNAARFADLNNQIALAGASQKAGAMTNARIGADQMLDNKRLAAISMGRNLPSQQLSAISTGSGVGNSNSGLFGAQNAPMFQGFQGAQGGLQGALGAQSSMANVMNMGYQNQVAASNAENAGMGGLGQLIGTGAQMYATGGMSAFGMADGGEVRGGKNRKGKGGHIKGPGTGTSDSVRALNRDSGQPILLSNGEYILPADTVRKVGKQALDKMVKATHKPVRTQAIKRG